MSVAVPKFQRLRDGLPTTADDPERAVWYGAGCSFWTDDWTKLNATRGIPCCPCGCVGFNTTAKDWFAGATKFEANGHPRYVEFLNSYKEQCSRINFLKQWEAWYASVKDQT